MTDTWYFLNLGDGMMAPMLLSEIEEGFQRFFVLAGSPRDMAVFTRSESEGRLHCEVVAYFSPSAEEVALAFEALPCRKPSYTGLGLAAGDEHSWSDLFPEKR
ncbi:MAG TPA: hypothetical protein PKL78_10285 [Anaerolineales bacterium]|nr:hypothetical protein [Anaerolineales bacterium]HNO32353.1 hypothetical protein [Anaerolineales bacterium]